MQAISSRLVEVYELAQHAEGLYENTGGEVDWRSEQLQAWLAESSGKTVEALCQFHAEASGIESAAKDEIERLRGVIDRQQTRQEWARKLLLEVLRVLGVRRIEHGTWHVHIRRGNGRVERVGDVDLSFLDPSLVRSIPAREEPDLTAIGKRLRKGDAVEGFRLVEGEEGVVIK